MDLLTQLTNLLAEGKTQEFLNLVNAILLTDQLQWDQKLAVAQFLYSKGQDAVAEIIVLKVYLANPLAPTVHQTVEQLLAATGKRTARLEQVLRESPTHFRRIAELFRPPNHLVFADLGASGSDFYRNLQWLGDGLKIIALDGVSVASNPSANRHVVRKVIAGTRRQATFHEKHWIDASSIFPDDPEIVRNFGMEKYTEIKQLHTVETTTLPEVLSEAKLDRIDALKTDLEGADFEVVQSIEPLLPKLHFLKMELAFIPRYRGEPTFDEVHAYLVQHHFKIQKLRPESWKYRTEHMDYGWDGTLVWGDFDYTNKQLESVDDPALRLRHIFLAAHCGFRNYAEFLLSRSMHLLESSVAVSLQYCLFADATTLQPNSFNPSMRHMAQ